VRVSASWEGCVRGVWAMVASYAIRSIRQTTYGARRTAYGVGARRCQPTCPRPSSALTWQARTPFPCPHPHPHIHTWYLSSAGPNPIANLVTWMPWPRAAVKWPASCTATMMARMPTAAAEEKGPSRLEERLEAGVCVCVCARVTTSTARHCRRQRVRGRARLGPL
jgi:hypothetical protein